MKIAIIFFITFIFSGFLLADNSMPSKPKILKEKKNEDVKDEVYPHSTKDLAPRSRPAVTDRKQITRMQRMLKTRGYDVEDNGKMDDKTKKALRSFKDEVWLSRNNGTLDSRTLKELEITFQPFL